MRILSFWPDLGLNSADYTGSKLLKVFHIIQETATSYYMREWAPHTVTTFTDYCTNLILCALFHGQSLHVLVL